MKYILGLLALCFCLSLSVDVGAVEQPIKTEFVQAQAPVFCELLVLDFARVPTFVEAIAPGHPDQPGESHGNPERSCGRLENVVTVTCPSLRFEAPSDERYRNRTKDSVASVSANNEDNCLSDFKVGWQA